MSFSSDPALLANQLSVSLDFPEPDNKEFNNMLTLFTKRTVDAVNTKEGALYWPVEVATFQQYFTPSDPQNNRPTYRMTVNFGALPNTTTKSVAHGIDFGPSFNATRIYGAATDPVNLLYLPLPYASPDDATNIEMYIDATNVVITTGSDRSTFPICTVVIEYTKISQPTL